jgi:hypothetical protein
MPDFTGAAAMISSNVFSGVVPALAAQYGGIGNAYFEVCDACMRTYGTTFTRDAITGSQPEGCCYK